MLLTQVQLEVNEFQPEVYFVLSMEITIWFNIER